VWTEVIVRVLTVSVIVLTRGRNSVIVYCGRWLDCDYVVLL